MEELETQQPQATTHEGGQAQRPGIEAVASTVRLPPFWEEDPTLWFVQVEAVFAANRITATGHKFNLVISQLPYKNLAQVADLAKEPGSNPYQSIKERLIQCYSQSQERRVLRLLEDTQLGDDRPSQLLRQMRAISDNSLSEQVLKTVWLRALPTRVRNIVTALDQTLEQIAQVADRILDSDPNVGAVAKQEETSQADLIAEIKRLKAIIKRDKSRTRSTERTHKKPWLCFYHFRFKEKARKCSQPCDWKKNAHTAKSQTTPLN